MENQPKSAGVFNYSIGDIPNVAMLFIGWCCCCGIGSLLQLHNIRTELKKAFPQVDDSLHWPMVIIAIWGMFMTNADLEKLEKENNISYTSNIPIILLLIIPVLWPFAEAEMMKRLNALAEKRG